MLSVNKVQSEPNVIILPLQCKDNILLKVNPSLPTYALFCTILLYK